MIHSARTLAVPALCFAATAHAQRADTVLLNGKIVTADERGAIHQAVAVRDGRIVALGKSAWCAAWRARTRASSICTGARSSPG